MAFYIRADDVFYFLDATTDIRTTRTSTLSKNPTANRKTASDNLINDTPTVSIQGVITDIKSPNGSSTLTFAQYLDGIGARRDSKLPFSLKYRLDLEDDDDWYITELEVSQNTTNGYGGESSRGVVQSASISIQLQKALYPEAITVIVDTSTAYSDALSTKKEKAASTASFSDAKTNEERAQYFEDQAILASERVNSAIAENFQALSGN